jgi:ABC-type amino acid transport substrate-binding protein
MTRSAKTFGMGCAALLLSGASALAQEACGTYVVAAGDNLRLIARSAYGDADLYRAIFEANITTIGKKADLIEIGTVLSIPCDPSAAMTEVIDPAKEPVTEPVMITTASAEPEAEPEPEPEPQVTTPAAEVKTFGIVTGNGYAPFTDETLPGGGMVTQLVEMGIFRADPAIPYNLTFINDWQAHIDALLPSGAYDLSFPWIRPDCDSGAMLSAGDQARCDNFVFSAPLYEIVDGFFATRESGLALATKYTDLEGKRICRPEGYTTGVLDAVGLSVPTIELIRPAETEDCFEALIAGKVDLVSIDAEVGDTAIANLGIANDVQSNPYLTTLQSLHAIAHKSNADAVELVAKLDGGVVEMYESGEWYDIVSTALTASMEK